MNIAVFYHGLFAVGNPPEMIPHAVSVVSDQMEQLKESGLLEAATEFYVGVNGGAESEVFGTSIFPEKARVWYHGNECRNELRTLMMLQSIMKGRKDWNVLYFHSKGATHPPTEESAHKWRGCMMRQLVWNWKACLHYLGQRYDSVGCHWKTGQVDGTQNLWAGNFWWARSEFLDTLPPIENHPRIPLMGGVDSLQSRFEAEVWLGGGPRRPRVKDFHPEGPWNCA